MLLFEDAVQKLNIDKKLKQLDQIKKIEYNIFQKTDIVEANDTLLLLGSRYNELSASREASKALRLKLNL